MSEPEQPSFRPSRRAWMVLATIGAAALALAAYMRYALVEPASVGLACDAGAQTAVCLVRGGFVRIFTLNGFGFAAILLTVVALFRPSVPLVAVALAFALSGVVLYNTEVSALALALLPLVLSRPGPRRAFQPRQ